MEKVYDKCCGIDVHKKLIVACLLCGRKSEIREFGATTDELLKLSDWLVSAGCEMAAMESTASYWKPLYNVLEYSGLNAMVVNAQHMRAEDGCEGCGMDRGFASARPAQGQLHPIQRSAGIARVGAVS